MADKQVVQEEETNSQNAKEMLQEERYLWMARAFVVMLVLAVICDIVLLIALGSVTPVMRVQPFYIETQNKEQQVISVSRPSEETLNSDALQESLVRQYLMDRFGVEADLKRLEQRWGDDGSVAWMSSQSVFEEFKKEAQILQKKAEKDNFVRNVEIQNVNKSPQSSSRYNTWRADIILKEKDRASVKETKSLYEAVLRVNFRPAQKGLTWENRLKNPFGFVVLEFGLTPKSQK